MKNTRLIILAILILTMLLSACSLGPDVEEIATQQAAQVALAVSQTQVAAQATELAGIKLTQEAVPPTPTNSPVPPPTNTPEPTWTSVPPTEAPTLVPSPTVPLPSPTTIAQTSLSDQQFTVTVRDDWGKTVWVVFAGRQLTLNNSVIQKTFTINGGSYYMQWYCWTSFTTPNKEGSATVIVSSNAVYSINKSCGLTIR